MFYEPQHSDVIDYIYHDCDENLNFEKHLHNSFEFVTVLAGNMSIIIDDIPYHISPGEAVLILPHQIHSYITEKYAKYYLCIFSTSYLDDFYEETKDKLPKNQLFAYTNKAVIDCLESKPKDKYKLRACFYDILSSFSKTAQFTPRKERDDHLISVALSYLENNPNSDITLKKLSAVLGYDYHYMSLLFNKTFQMGFSEFVNKYRIFYAQRLLKEKKLSISEIATKCGYSSLRSFNRNFQNRTGCTPSDYRKSASTESNNSTESDAE